MRAGGIVVPLLMTWSLRPRMVSACTIKISVAVVQKRVAASMLRDDLCCVHTDKRTCLSKIRWAEKVIVWGNQNVHENKKIVFAGQTCTTRGSLLQYVSRFMSYHTGFKQFHKPTNIGNDRNRTF